jgi:hypothetical protein
MLVDDLIEALGFGGPYPALVFSGLFTLRRRRRDCLQKIFCWRFVAKSHVRTALIISDPPSLNWALCLSQGLEPVDIAAQGRSITDDVRAIEGRSDFA